jgi:alkyl hydroperoxide reductase subunit AhpF
MEFLPKKEAEELASYLEGHLTAPVALDYFTIPASNLWVPGRPECQTCEDTGRLLAEVAALSDKITLRVHDVFAEPEAAEATGVKAGHLPAIVLSGLAKGRVRFLGIPAGLEFATLLRSLIEVASGTTGLAEPAKERLRGLEKDVHIRSS